MIYFDCSRSRHYHQDNQRTNPQPIAPPFNPTRNSFKKTIPIRPFYKNGMMKNDNPLLVSPDAIILYRVVTRYAKQSVMISLYVSGFDSHF